MHIERTTEPPPDWDAIHGEDPRATMFLHPRWMEALVRAYPLYRPLYLVAREGNSVVGILPLVHVRRWGLDQFLSLPSGAHGGPLLRASAPPETSAELAAAFRALVSGARTLRFEMSIHAPPSDLRAALAPAFGPFFQDLRTHVIDLEGGALGLWPRYRRSARRSIRAAEEAGVLVGLDRSAGAIEALHRLHEDQSRDWAGIPPYSLGVIRSTAAAFGMDARLYTARFRDQVIAACLCLEHGGREVHPWVSGASPASRELGAFHSLIDAALRDVAARGFKTWYFGGSGGNARIEFFKESFSARPVPLLRCFHLAGWARRLRRRPAWDAAVSQKTNPGAEGA